MKWSLYLGKISGIKIFVHWTSMAVPFIKQQWALALSRLLCRWQHGRNNKYPSSCNIQNTMFNQNISISL